MGKKGGGVRMKQLGPKGAGGANGLSKLMTNPMEEFMIPPDEMVHLPPTPDRGYQMFWPMHETFSMDPTGFWILYPSYIDSTKSLKEGRRIGTDVAVVTPTVTDISHALQSLQIRHVIQPYKGYPRDIGTLWDNPGRVKVEPTTLNDDSNRSRKQPQQLHAYTKRALMIKIASILPTLPGRIQRLEQEEAAKAIEDAKRLEQLQQQAIVGKHIKAGGTLSSQKSTSTATTTATSTTNAKKKGKKKR